MPQPPFLSTQIHRSLKYFRPLRVAAQTPVYQQSMESLGLELGAEYGEHSIHVCEIGVESGIAEASSGWGVGFG